MISLRVMKTIANFRIGDQIQIALPVARLHVFQAVPFFGQRQQDLGEEEQFFDMNTQLAGLGAEQIAGNADDVADIE